MKTFLIRYPAFAVLLTLLACCGGCFAPTAATIREFHSRIDHDGQISFVSRAGRRVGMDDDFMIAFLSNNHAILERALFGDQLYAGTYSLGSNGVITFRFPRAPSPCQDLLLRMDGISLLLQPAGRCSDKYMLPCPESNGIWDVNIWPFRPPTQTEPPPSARDYDELLKDSATMPATQED